MSYNVYDALKLENQFCFPLYACAKEIVKQYRPYLEQLNLTYTQYIAMMVFWEHKKLNVRDLGAKLYLDSGTLTPVLKSLEAKGLVHRFRSSDDERVLLVEITEAGEALKFEALSVPAKIAGCVRLTPDESADLYRLLYKMLDAMQAK